MKQAIISFFYSKSKVHLGLLVTCLLVLLIISFSFLPFGKNSRKVFFFTNQKTGRISSEVRTIPKQKNELQFEQFIRELLLGPINPNYVPVMPTSTIIESSFIRNGSAYLSFSSHALENSLNGVDFTKTIELFKKNVCTNFRNVARIYMYIDGKEVYEQEYFKNAAVKK